MQRFAHMHREPAVAMLRLVTACLSGTIRTPPRDITHLLPWRSAPFPAVPAEEYVMPATMATVRLA
eukprot:12746944-Alexandrium_andersonii.AAC.1